MIKLIMSLLFMFAVSSCSSMSGKECMSTNWYQKGMADARNGKPKSTLGNYKDACIRNGIQFDNDEYIEGFEKGLNSK